MADAKVIKIKAGSDKGFWTRSVFSPTTEKIMQKEIEKWAKKGYTLANTTPVTDKKGKTTHYLLTFQKE